MTLKGGRMMGVGRVGRGGKGGGGGLGFAGGAVALGPGAVLGPAARGARHHLPALHPLQRLLLRLRPQGLSSCSTLSPLPTCPFATRARRLRGPWAGAAGVRDGAARGGGAGPVRVPAELGGVRLGAHWLLPAPLRPPPLRRHRSRRRLPRLLLLRRPRRLCPPRLFRLARPSPPVPLRLTLSLTHAHTSTVAQNHA
eukprot:370762-Rhodomonas_salina.1